MRSIVGRSDCFRGCRGVGGKNCREVVKDYWEDKTKYNASKVFSVCCILCC